jgi:large subunit ribosomal protein L9
MQVILMEKIGDLGQLGDVVKVKEGYARNYLIPHGKAKRATEKNLAEFQVKRDELEKQHTQTLAQAQERAVKLEGYLLQVSQKAGVDGRLFGSVTGGDIAEALKAQGFEVTKAEVRLPNGPLKQVGDHPLVIALHSDVTATITVSVLGEA